VTRALLPKDRFLVHAHTRTHARTHALRAEQRHTGAALCEYVHAHAYTLTAGYVR
jgi:hypothetical protein